MNAAGAEVVEVRDSRARTKIVERALYICINLYIVIAIRRLLHGVDGIVPLA